jgi:hypothetical protein
MIVVALATGVAWGQSPTVVRVEEDWEMVVAEPDVDSDAPQVTCMISPLAEGRPLYASLELNHHTLPDYVPGGLQLQVWNGDQAVAVHTSPITALLQTPNELVKWTQCMEVNGGNLIIEVINGSSTTWGSFGGQGYLQAIVASTLSDLNSYRPQVSIANSSVGFAANRVQSLVLKRVRYKMSNGQVWEDATPRVVTSQP